MVGQGLLGQIPYNHTKELVALTAEHQPEPASKAHVIICRQGLVTQALRCG
jgi:hypothetical protein